MNIYFKNLLKMIKIVVIDILSNFLSNLTNHPKCILSKEFFRQY